MRDGGCTGGGGVGARYRNKSDHNYDKQYKKEDVSICILTAGVGSSRKHGDRQARQGHTRAGFIRFCLHDHFSNRLLFVLC